MVRWSFALALDDASDTPLFLQIARAIADEVRRGRLLAGDRLPGSRALARSLAVHRNTVLAAYAELTAQGWTTTEPARGTFVSSALPDPRPRRFATAAARTAVPARPGFDMAGSLGPEGPARHPPARPSRPRSDATISMLGGLPDTDLIDGAELARAYRRVLRRDGARALDYGDARGDGRLRAALATMLSATRGLAASAEDVVVTRGSQMALYLAARVLVRPGDVVAVEAFGYRPAWEAFRIAGARLVPIPVDANGLRVDRLARLAETDAVRAVYVTPHHQYPTTVTLSAGRRLELLALARARKFAIVEDDYDHEFHYEGRPVLPLASVDTAGVVVYVGTLSKVLAPGLRIGYVVAPASLLRRIVAYRSYVDHVGDQVVERAVAELLEDGDVQRHVRRARRVYLARRDAVTDALRTELPDALSFTPPSGGMALWARVARGIDLPAWVARGADKGVVFSPAREFAFDGRGRPFIRLGFAAYDEATLRAGVARMVAAL